MLLVNSLGLRCRRPMRGSWAFSIHVLFLSSLIRIIPLLCKQGGYVGSTRLLFSTSEGSIEGFWHTNTQDRPSCEKQRGTLHHFLS
jgi:lysophospholipid acyltransferase (LPLAT)-like uncharacterized protein